jgi:hypothetical protein
LKNKWVQAETLAVIAASLIFIFLLIIKPIVGVADNGDFLRIMGTTGLNYVDAAEVLKDKYFGFIHSQYLLQGMGIGGYISTEIITVLIASAIARIFSFHGIFDIRILAVEYAFIFLCAMYWLLKLNKQASSWKNGFMAVLFIVVFADVGYTAYYNSLFGEPVTFTFLLLTLAFAHILLKEINPSKRLLVFFLIAAFFLVGAKVQNAPLGIILALLTLRFGQLRDDKRWKRLVSAISVILIVVSIGTYLSAPKELKQINQYQTVFYGILKDSPDPRADLIALGLDPAFAVNAGSNYFTADVPIKQQAPMLQQHYYPNISHQKVALFYLQHPARFLNKLEVTAHSSMTNRPYYLGNYEKSAGRAYGAVSNAFGWWSEFKRTFMPSSLWFIVLFSLMYFVVLVLKYRLVKDARQRIQLEIYMAVGLMAWISFIVPVIGDGEADLSKHLFMFDVCFDLMFVASCVWLVSVLPRWLFKTYNPN